MLRLYPLQPSCNVETILFYQFQKSTPIDCSSECMEYRSCYCLPSSQHSTYWPYLHCTRYHWQRCVCAKFATSRTNTSVSGVEMTCAIGDHCNTDVAKQIISVSAPSWLLALNCMLQLLLVCPETSIALYLSMYSARYLVRSAFV